jgi:hypothetical protein
LAVRFWGVPIIVAVAGTVLAYGLLTGTTRRTLINLVVGIVHRLGATTRRWHSGLVGDYAVWNAFGTAVVLMALLLANRMGYR